MSILCSADAKFSLKIEKFLTSADRMLKNLQVAALSFTSFSIVIRSQIKLGQYMSDVNVQHSQHTVKLS